MLNKQLSLYGKIKKFICELKSTIDAIYEKSHSDNLWLKTQLYEIKYEQLYTRYLLCKNNATYYESTPALIKEIISLEDAFNALKGIVPKAYDQWRELLEVNAKTYDGFPLHSCSMRGHPMATLFKYFITPYLSGRILDIGCGPQSVPCYLNEVPLHSLYGLDPLSNQSDHPFPFHKGVAEFLPWCDGQFNVVVAATSLDHVLLLDKVFDEVYRVLDNGGFLIVWLAYVAGSKMYDPYDESIVKVDDYHMFHFDKSWLCSVLGDKFSIIHEINFELPHASTFLVMTPKKSFK